MCVCAVCGEWMDERVCVWRGGHRLCYMEGGPRGRGPEPQGRGKNWEGEGAGREGCRAQESSTETRAEQVWRGGRGVSRNSSSVWPGSGWASRGPGAWSSVLSPEGNEMLLFVKCGLDGILFLPQTWQIPLITSPLFFALAPWETGLSPPLPVSPSPPRPNPDPPLGLAPAPAPRAAGWTQGLQCSSFRPLPHSASR